MYEPCIRGLHGPGLQVTRVGRGDRLGEALGRASYENMTVEDLLRIIRGLGPEESVVPPVEHSLSFLDSRALAALLKELAKVRVVDLPQELAYVQIVTLLM